jgi:hypothetical protein
MSFLPTTYDRIPTNSDYMKLRDGDNNFRVLSSAVVGYEYWNTNNKPVRSRDRWDYIPADCKQEKDGQYKINHFWAFVVWNYDEKRVQILEVTQKQIMTQLKAYVDNARWGDPKKYDITISRSGTGFDTEYIVQPNPPINEPDAKVLEAYAKRPVNLEGLFDGTDPFGGEADVKAAGTLPMENASAPSDEAPLPEEPGKPAPDFLK